MSEQAGHRRRRTWVIVGVVVGSFVLLSCFGMLMMLLVFVGMSPDGGWGDRVGIVRISGEIGGSSGGLSLLREVVEVESTMELLREAAEDGRTKAIVLRINSPGGSASAAQEIYQAIRRVKEKTGKPVVASLGDVAASGAYYVAAAADKIVATPATLTGSIGVIMELENFEEVMKKIGVRFDTIKSGKHKDIGSPFRGMTSEERGIMRSLIMDVYDQFISDVARGRNLSKERVRQLADGRMFTGRQAKALGLVDELGGLQEAVTLAARLAQMRDEPQVYEFKRGESLMDILIGSVIHAIRLEVREALSGGLRRRGAGVRMK
ncbi:MAG: signal peptide peptidase SppA [Abditibacteriales bacterium]|nr:signal peptide peptidase SppA [Abditibacteriales bacterium]MDW8365277.1 signal peptide peptidase SppA [Abditibacteriales bacterium]